MFYESLNEMLHLSTIYPETENIGKPGRIWGKGKRREGEDGGGASYICMVESIAKSLPLEGNDVNLSGCILINEMLCYYPLRRYAPALPKGEPRLASPFGGGAPAGGGEGTHPRENLWFSINIEKARGHPA